MSQGGHWSQMVSGDVDADDVAILPIGTQPSQPSAPRRRPIRAANYTPDEDLQLCEKFRHCDLQLQTMLQRRRDFLS
jgi:hypothetical protein